MKDTIFNITARDVELIELEAAVEKIGATIEESWQDGRTANAWIEFTHLTDSKDFEGELYEHLDHAADLDITCYFETCYNDPLAEDEYEAYRREVATSAYV